MFRRPILFKKKIYNKITIFFTRNKEQIFSPWFLDNFYK